MVGVNGGSSCHDNEIKPGQLALMESETLPDQAFDAVAVNCVFEKFFWNRKSGL